MNPNDSDVIALSKAIIQRESKGNFNAVGDAGTSHGAAQWQAATWKAQAHDVLGNPDAPMTPENQKAVLQVTVAKRKAAGLNPAQIAAEWNSGHPDGWENKIGVAHINGQEVPYNVPQYVKDVTDLYHQYKGQGGQVGSLLQGSHPQGEGFGGGLVQSQQDSSQLDQKIHGILQKSQSEPQGEESLGDQLKGRGQDVVQALGLSGQGVNETMSGHPVRGLFDVGSGVLQTVGAAAGGAGDIIGKGFGLIPGVKQAEGLIGQGVGKLAQTGPGKAVVGAAQDFSAKHPVVAKDIGSAFNIGSLATGGIGGKIAKDAVEEGVVQGARKGILGGLAKDVAQKSAVKQAEELLGSTPTKGAVKSAVRGGRVSVEGGVPGVVNDAAKQASVDEVARAIMEGKIPKGLAADKSAAIKKAADDMAVDLEKQLSKERPFVASPDGVVQSPYIHPREIDDLLNSALEKIGQDPTMVGNAEESAKRILNKFKSFLPQGRDITASDILQARKSLDQWIGGLAGGSKVFDPAYENAKSIALRAIRQGANDLVAAKAPDVTVKDLLRRQSHLYRALDYVVPNVKAELGTTRLKRFSRRHPLVTAGVKTAAKGAALGLGFKEAADLIP